MGYSWNDFVSNQRLPRETESRPITTIVCQRQLRLYGHVARYPEADPACRFVSEMDNLGWRRPRGGAHRVIGWGKLMLPVGSYLVWERGLHGDLYGVIVGVCVGGLARRRALRGMAPMID